MRLFSLIRPVLLAGLVVLALFGVLARPQAPTAAQGSADDFEERNILIRFKEGVSEQERIAFERRELLEFVSEIHSISVRVYRLPEGAAVKETAERVTQDPAV